MVQKTEMMIAKLKTRTKNNILNPNSAQRKGTGSSEYLLMIWDHTEVRLSRNAKAAKKEMDVLTICFSSLFAISPVVHGSITSVVDAICS